MRRTPHSLEDYVEQPSNPNFQISNYFLKCDFFNENLRQILPVTGLFLVAFAPFLFENDHFFAPHVAQNFAGYGGSRYRGRTDLYGTGIIDKKYLVEYEGSAFLARQPVGVEETVFFNFELLTCDFYNCVHDFI